jgi:hypothetical protein
MAPSNPKPPPTPSPDPVYPFEMVCADYFQHGGEHYLVLVDRYSGWPEIWPLTGGAGPLVDRLSQIFNTFGIPTEISTDGGPEFTAQATQQFLKAWGVSHRLSSVAYPHSNCRAEVGVKTSKRLITENSTNMGKLDIPPFQRAILQYRNTPASAGGMSPAEVVFGHQIRDFIPVRPGKYVPQPAWSETAMNRELAMMQKHSREMEDLSPHTKELPPLRVGDTVRVQNQTGNSPGKWDRTGDVVEVRQHDQYLVKIHGSGRTTPRNRMFLRKYTPFVPRQPVRVLSDDRPRELRQPVEFTPPIRPYRQELVDTSTPLGVPWQSPPLTPVRTPAFRTPATSPSPRGLRQPVEFPSFSPTPGPNRGSPELSPFHGFETPGTPPHTQDSQEEVMAPPPMPAFLPATPTGRPRRERKPPVRMNDYEMYIE